MSEEKDTKLPSRSDYKYIEEEYELYELTHCIAYEMAIRNEEVKSFIATLDELSLLHKKFTIHSLTNSITFTVIPWYQEVLEILSKHNKIAFWFDALEEIKDANITYNLIMVIIAKLVKVLEDEYYMVDERKSIIPEDMEETFNEITDYESDSKLNEHMEEALLNGNHYKDSYFAKNGYRVYQGAYKEDNKLSCFKIKPNFKKPLKQFNQAEISLNISLPKKELLAFVEKIKDDYDDKKSSIPNYLEFLGKELGIDSKFYKNMTAEKWADHFYVYDVLKSHNRKKIKEEIRLELTKYHGIRVIESEKEYKKGTKRNSKILEEDIIVPKYKSIPYEQYFKENPEMSWEDLEHPFNEDKYNITIKSISNYEKLMKKLIEGKNPSYKILLAR